MLLLALGEYLKCRQMVCAYMQHFQYQKVVKYQSNAGVYQVPDSVWFDQVQITDVLEPVPVHCGQTIPSLVKTSLAEVINDTVLRPNQSDV